MIPGRQQDIVSRVSRRLAEFDRAKTFAMRNARPIVSFTFDDIPDSALDNGARALSRNGVHGVLRRRRHLRDGSVRLALRGRREPAQARRRNEIACHTFSHPDAQTLDRAALEREFEANSAFFATLDPRVSLDNFAYPYGSVGLRQKRAVQERFLSCRSVREGINAGRVDLGFLKAVRLYDSEIARDGIDAVVAETVQLNGWLIFYTHDVANPPSKQGCSPALLEMAVRSAKAAGCECLSVREALAAIGIAAPAEPAPTAQTT